MRIVTLVFVHDNQKVLLGYKKRGFGAGRWNGFGGKVETGETLEQAARRELKEESGLEVAELQPRAELEFTFHNGDHLLCHVFSASEASGEPIETEEMKPVWYAHHEVPYQDMWADDAVWLPHLLAGKNFKAYFEFDSEQGNQFSSHKIEFIND